MLCSNAPSGWTSRVLIWRVLRLKQIELINSTNSSHGETFHPKRCLTGFVLPSYYMTSRHSYAIKLFENFLNVYSRQGPETCTNVDSGNMYIHA